MKTNIIPAIDILNGKFVRLSKGNFKKKKYSLSFKRYINFLLKKNIKNLHIVDLDGARFGKPKNKSIISKIIKIFKKKGIKIQVGGGIRKKKDVYFYLKKKARVIISTLFFEKKMKKISKKNVIISIDYRNKRVLLKGWKKKNVSLKKAINKAKKSKFKYFIFTNIKKDGSERGMDIKNIKYICKKMKNKKLMFAGGFNNKKKIIKKKNIYGIIAGSYYYNKCIKE
ncbi:Phosphoribosylformimino-5-aminoimidazole carboxamide ribotide isomerase [Candidatus Vidania fulgoroideae]|nr:Phosphoribosylformimino-5-aminoimidazole carboxamide ribotide isomerase [Candidatus Vidania fulgoroideae]